MSCGCRDCERQIPLCPALTKTCASRANYATARPRSHLDGSAELPLSVFMVLSARSFVRSWSSALRFMKSLFSLSRMHWDHEPTPNPSQEGNRRGADECLLPSWEGSGVGRFMERARLMSVAGDEPFA